MNIENTPTPEALSILTEKQRQAYLLRKEGLTYTAIAKRMGNTATAARQSCHGAERRLEEYEQYQSAQERNNEIVNFPITRGELRVIHEGLQWLEKDLRKNVRFAAQTDWHDRLPYTALILCDLLARVEKELYGFSFPTCIK